jgi:hypothetical protein
VAAGGAASSGTRYSGTTVVRTTIPESSTRVWVTTTAGAMAYSPGSASASGSTTSEFRVTDVNTSARRSPTAMSSRAATAPASSGIATRNAT